MDVATVLAAIVVVAIVALVVATLRRTSRTRALAPAKLGPTWRPAATGGAEEGTDTSSDGARSSAVSAHTGVPTQRADEALVAWDEYLAVLGLRRLPPGHVYRYYDPYVPPVAERGPEGPVPDRRRVAHDVSARTGMPQSDVLAVIEADAALG